MDDLKNRAKTLLQEFKGDSYIFGLDCLDELGGLVSQLGRKSLLVTNLREWDSASLLRITSSLKDRGIEISGPVPSAAPNAPRDDVSRLTEEIGRERPDTIVVADGGSGIDAVKAASVLSGCGGDVEDYFGVGKVTQKLQQEGKKLIPVVAVQTASSSAAHLTKYSNITDVRTAQKKLIVDEAIVPSRALFDYGLTVTMPPDFTLDGAFDGIAHSLEVFFGATPDTFEKISEIASVCIELVISGVGDAVSDGTNVDAREALGLGTDLGGYAIMVGGTNGGHLTSFSLVDILSHGRACAIMNPYYTVFFGPAIQDQLKILADIYKKYGLISGDISGVEGRELAEIVAKAMIDLAKKVNFPTTLGEIPGFQEDHIQKALAAAKNPQLEMKLKNMPIPLTAGMIDNTMGPILKAAAAGDFSLIKNV
jgi:alcohol dehydrogenase class IV